MKPSRFKYIRARSLTEALDAKALHGEGARFLAGGQSLVPAMNFRMAQPDVLIDINGLSDVAQLAQAARETRIGALARYRTLERDGRLLERFELLADALPLISHSQIRARTTLGGNLCHADPASEMPAVMLALDARMAIASSRGTRDLAARAFFVDTLTTALADDEMLVGVSIDTPATGNGACFMETSRRRGDFAIVGVAATLTLDRGTCTSARIALCGIGATAVLIDEAARALVGTSVEDADIAAAARIAMAAIDPPGSLQAGADYQRHLTGVLVTRAATCARARSLAATESLRNAG
jgi:CO/xanthine dehydrogenase FAD-binding subunit